MKRLVLLTFFSLCIMLGASANAVQEGQMAEPTALSLAKLDATPSHWKSVETPTYRTCTISGNVSLTTESGDCVSVEFTVTASTCAEAMRVQNNLLTAFEDAQ